MPEQRFGGGNDLGRLGNIMRGQESIGRERAGAGLGELLLAAEAPDACVDDCIPALGNPVIEGRLSRKLLGHFAQQAPVLLVDAAEGEDLIGILARGRDLFELPVEPILGRPQLAQLVGDVEHRPAQGQIVLGQRNQRIGLAGRVANHGFGLLEFAAHFLLLPRVHAPAELRHVGHDEVELAPEQALLRRGDRFACRQAENFLLGLLDTRREVLAHRVVLDLVRIDQYLRGIVRQRIGSFLELGAKLRQFLPRIELARGHRSQRLVERTTLGTQ